MRYKKFLVGCLMCCGFLSLSDNHIIKADYFTDYNTTVLDSIMIIMQSYLATRKILIII